MKKDDVVEAFTSSSCLSPLTKDTYKFDAKSIDLQRLVHAVDALRQSFSCDSCQELLFTQMTNIQDLHLETCPSSSFSCYANTDDNYEKFYASLKKDNLSSDDYFLPCRRLCRTCQQKEGRTTYSFQQRADLKTTTETTSNDSPNPHDSNEISIQDVLLRNGMEYQFSPKVLISSLRQLLEHISDQSTPNQVKKISSDEDSNDDDESLEEHQVPSDPTITNYLHGVSSQTQMYSNSETSFSIRNLPSTCDLERRLSSLWTCNNVSNSSGQSLQQQQQQQEPATHSDQTQEQTSLDRSSSTKDIRQTSLESECDTNFMACTSLLLEDNDSCVDSDTLPYSSLPGTFEFMRQLQTIQTPTTASTNCGFSSNFTLQSSSELIQNDLSKIPPNLTEPTPTIIVAVESIPTDQIDLFRNANPNIRFVNRICYHRPEQSQRILESSMEFAVYPSHFMTRSQVGENSKVTSHHSPTSHQRRVCSRTLEYLKAMALGLIIVDTLWIQDQNDDEHMLWGDSQLEQRIKNCHQHHSLHDDDEYSTWLQTNTDWWTSANNHGPCWSARQRRCRQQKEEKIGYCNNLLEGIKVLIPANVWDLKTNSVTATHNEPVSLLSSDEAELLCSLAGATCHVLQRDELFHDSIFDHTTASKPLIVLVPDSCTEDSIYDVLDVFPMLAQDDGNAFHIDFWTEDEKGDNQDNVEKETKQSTKATTVGTVIFAIVKESWLVESISSSAVAPISFFTLAVISNVEGSDSQKESND